MKAHLALGVLIARGISALPSNVLTERAAAANGTVTYAGVNIAGFDFGCLTDGSQDPKKAVPPVNGLGGPDGAAQMSHFVKDDHFNIFRLPVGWQYLTGSTLSSTSTLNAGNLQKYDQLVQACLRSASTTVCVLDIHNYARWNKQIIGQGGPTNAQFVGLWTQLAAKYKGETRIAFGLMNEPHEVDINKWADTLQLVVNAIRGAGATTQMSEPETYLAICLIADLE
ncbi:putative endoglucanase EG-II [Glarea lozoyensis 74030]|uniref:cellulase n=1 Tax=Glarea lozoyensis (strain ATCC 74030 / MF5533) TaxID=1104152 RepID=H0EMA7_GLAL7|nr:putative endoglucanase EG-II [Glarea lozoyensis 74030]